MEPRVDTCAQDDRHVYCVEGKTVELWEHPGVPFGWGEEELSDYASSGRWEFLFNALVLSSFLDERVPQP